MSEFLLIYIGLIMLAISVGYVISSLVIALAPRCERCGGLGRAGRCPVCGEWLCRSCKPVEGLCRECWETEDGKEADRAKD